MATAKKPASKKTTTKKASASKAVVTKKAPAKKTTAKKRAAPKVRSFKASKSDVPFTSFKITRQTVYWIILVSFIILMQLWIIQLQIDVAQLIEQQEYDLQSELY